MASRLSACIARLDVNGDPATHTQQFAVLEDPQDPAMHTYSYTALPKAGFYFYFVKYRATRARK